MQADVQLVVMVQGHAEVEVDGTVLRIPACHSRVFLPGRREWFRFTPDGPTRHTWVSLGPSYVPPAVLSALETNTLHRAVGARLTALIELGLLAIPGTQDDIGGVHLRALALACLTEFVRSEPGVGLPDALERAEAYLQAHCDQPLDGGTLARAAYVSQQHLIRLYRRHLCTTPMRRVWEVRTGRGIDLLRETGLSIGEISVRCGFKSPYHFSRLVKLRTGLSPRQLRESSWSAEP
jgi:AraC family transcriptional regulator of arabinose operon